MAVEVECRSCGAILRPSPAALAAGATFPCPDCRAQVSLPPPAPAEPEPEPEPEPLRRRDRPRKRLHGRPRSSGVPAWVWLAGGGVVLVLLIGVGLRFGLAGRSLFGPSVTQADVDRVQPGMTPDQVRDLLGRPTEEVDSGAMFGAFAQMAGQPPPPGAPQFRIWQWTDHRTFTAVVQFANDRVIAKGWVPAPPNRGGGFGPDGRSDAQRRMDEDRERLRQLRERTSRRY